LHNLGLLPCAGGLRALHVDGHEKVVHGVMATLNRLHNPIIEERIREWSALVIRPRGCPQAREREEKGDHSREGSPYSKEATTSGGGRRGPAKTPPEEKEDIVGSVTMINGAMLSTLIG
jgi:hypothetical protein